MISIKSCNPFSRSECLAITEESCSFDSNIVFEFYCLLWLFAKLIKFLDYVLFLQVQTHFLEQYPAFSSTIVFTAAGMYTSVCSRIVNWMHKNIGLTSHLDMNATWISGTTFIAPLKTIRN